MDDPTAALSHDLKGAGVRRDLWPYLLGLAALLLPIDVGVRRLALGRRDLVRAWGWLAARLPHRRPRPVVQTPSPVARLFQAKSRAGERAPAGRDLVSETVPAEPEAATLPAERPSAPSLAAPSAAPREKIREDAEEFVEEDTLAGRLLRRKQEREDGT